MFKKAKNIKIIKKLKEISFPNGVKKITIFRNFNVATKILILIFIGALCLGAISFFSISGLNSINADMERIYSRHVMQLKNLSEAQNSFNHIQTELRTIWSAWSETEVDRYFSFIDEYELELLRCLDEADKLTVDEEEKQIINELRTAWQEYKKFINISRETFKTNGVEAGVTAAKDGNFVVCAKQMGSSFQSSVDNELDLAKANYENAASTGNRTKSFMVILTAVTLLISAAIGYPISKAIVNPLRLTLAQAEKLAVGDLTYKVSYTAKDEVGRLTGALNQAVEGIKGLISKVRDSAEIIGASSQQLAATAEEMAASNESQAEEISNASHTISEFAASIQQVAASSQAVSFQSQESAKIAGQGVLAAKEAISGMGLVENAVFKLGQNSEKIGQIVQLIDEISTQTNLLALNAAIEAARAGEHGRGFAVVADEVRKLAERSAKATKEITSLIGEIQKGTREAVDATNKGVIVMEKTETTFADVVEGAKNTATAVDRITAASKNQAVSSHEVAKMMEIIAGTTEEVSAGAEETAASTQQLAKMAEELSELIEQFKL